MWNKPDKKKLSDIPQLHETEAVPLRDKVIHVHFFIGSCDWYIAEFDQEDLFFGFAIINNDYEMAEWGYVSFQELVEINIHGIQVDCESSWTKCKASEIEKICKAQNWR